MKDQILLARKFMESKQLNKIYKFTNIEMSNFRHNKFLISQNNLFPKSLIF